MAEMTQHQTPHLTTALTGQLQLLEEQVLSQQEEIEKWFQAQWALTAAPTYGSVDLRNAGFKIAPVDMNLFPAGFNNIRLNPSFVPLAIEATKLAIKQANPNAKTILLIPENHTRNIFYWESVQSLLQIFTGAGYDIRIGSLLPDLEEEAEITAADGGKLLLSPAIRVESKLTIKDFIPDVVLLNNDLSDGIPEILKDLQQPVIPPAELGWSQRLKSEHFKYYAEVSSEFAENIGIDSWLIAPLFKQCGEIDFMRREGETCLAEQVRELFIAIRKKYDEYGITHQPYVVIKADAGTYGMAIMMVKSADEVLSLNRKQRTHMSKSKGGQSVDSVIIQEGVHTFETWGVDQAVAEPVVYLIGQRVVGGFYRVHKDRGVDENLNAPGMLFEPLPFSKPCHEPLKELAAGECQNRFYTYGVIARLSMLAAAREIAQQKNRG